MDWAKEIESARKLQPTHRRRVYGTDKHVIRITLKPDERDHFGGTHDYSRTLLADENLVKTTDLIRRHTAIPVPKVIHHIEGTTVLEMVPGVDLADAWDRISTRQLDGIKHELRGYIKQLWSIPNPFRDQFAVGSLCTTHEILFTVDPTYPQRGPFRTTPEYRTHIPGLFNRTPRFSPNNQPVLDHSDWSQSNIIIHPNLDKIAAIIDWEYAAFIPDPEDMHVGDVPVEEWRRPEWADIFAQLEQPRIDE
jgi:hypothetical protein